MTKKNWAKDEYPYPDTQVAAAAFFNQPADPALYTFIRPSDSRLNSNLTNRNLLDFVVVDLRSAVVEDYEKLAPLSGEGADIYHQGGQFLQAVETQIKVLDDIVAGRLPERSEAFALVDEGFRGALHTLMRIERGDFFEYDSSKPIPDMEDGGRFKKMVEGDPSEQARKDSGHGALDQLAFGIETLANTFTREFKQQRMIE